MERKQFTFYDSFAKAAERIRKKADRCEFYDALKDYALHGIEPDFDALPDAVAIALELVKPTLDTSRRRAENGLRGGNRKQTESKTEAKRKQTGSNPEANDKQTGSNPEARANAKQGQAGSKKKKEKEKELEDKNDSYYPPMIPPSTETGFEPKLQEAFETWLQYKGERKEPYKTTQGVKALIGQIRNKAEQYGADTVIDRINYSMSKEWMGIAFEDRYGNTPAPAKRRTGREANGTAGDYEAAALARMLEMEGG